MKAARPWNPTDLSVGVCQKHRNHVTVSVSPSFPSGAPDFSFRIQFFAKTLVTHNNLTYYQLINVPFWPYVFMNRIEKAMANNLKSKVVFTKEFAEKERTG